jgi:hypothetical protein
VDTVYIIKKGVPGNWTTNHETYPKKGNQWMKVNLVYHQQKDVVDLGLGTKNMWGWRYPWV